MTCSKHTRHNSLNRLIIGIGWTGAVIICAVARPAAAHRPFDGTGTNCRRSERSRDRVATGGPIANRIAMTLVAPEVVYNYGFAERWEMVLQGQARDPVISRRPSSLAATGAFLKYVVRPGVLQGQSGISIATDFGLCCPVSYLPRGRVQLGRYRLSTLGPGGPRISTSRPTSPAISMARRFSTLSLKDRRNGRFVRFWRCFTTRFGRRAKAVHS